ncbi:P-loop containing nucleoside triphosphate hydrolase protein, partial [Mycena albidolilacea]
MLPSKPKIFYGRESELDHMMKIIAQQPARIAILGGGGMGKTSLSRAVLHHPETSAKFEYRFFVSAESATTSIELAALIGLHIGLDPGKDLTKAVVQYFSRAPSLLLILDNLETVWDPIQSRDGIEEFLSLLTDVEHLTLIITMRGAERPAKVHWTHPFLLPLEPLSDEAAQQTFMDITDNVYAAEDVNQILGFTDNMPLAVDLIAHLSDYEGLSNVLTRWKTEKTALLSVGYDRKSNLDSSITLSLSSPRITHNSKELLSLLSILPDGLTAAQLAHGNLPISNVLSCKAALLATSLAYQDSNKQLRSLVPIREHIQRFLPPSKALIQSVCRHFYGLLELYQTYNGEQLRPVMNQITLNLGNLHEVLQRGLDDSLSDHTDTISCILSLNSFHRITGRNTIILMNHIHPMFPKLGDQLKKIQFTIEVLQSYTHPPGLDLQQLITEAIVLFKHVKNSLLESQFYCTAGFYFLYCRSNPSQAMSFFHK